MLCTIIIGGQKASLKRICLLTQTFTRTYMAGTLARIRIWSRLISTLIFKCNMHSNPLRCFSSYSSA